MFQDNENTALLEQFNYSNLNNELIENKKPTVKHAGYTAKRGGASGMFKGRDFIYLQADDWFDPLPTCSDGELFAKHELKLHISLPEENLEQRNIGWNIVKNILIEKHIKVSKVVRATVKMSSSALDGQEPGGQRGKDITIYTAWNPNLNGKDWLNIMNEITQSFLQKGIGDCLLPAEDGARACRRLYLNPYCTYRYESNENQLENDLIQTYYQEMIETINTNQNFLTINNSVQTNNYENEKQEALEITDRLEDDDPDQNKQEVRKCCSTQ